MKSFSLIHCRALTLRRKGYTETLLDLTAIKSSLKLFRFPVLPYFVHLIQALFDSGGWAIHRWVRLCLTIYQFSISPRIDLFDFKGHSGIFPRKSLVSQPYSFLPIHTVCSWVFCIAQTRTLLILLIRGHILSLCAFKAPFRHLSSCVTSWHRSF